MLQRNQVSPSVNRCQNKLVGHVTVDLNPRFRMHKCWTGFLALGLSTWRSIVSVVVRNGPDLGHERRKQLNPATDSVLPEERCG
jgi:hypothetical protein